MEEFSIHVEVEGEVEQSDRFGIEDRVADALRELGLEVVEVRVIF